MSRNTCIGWSLPRLAPVFLLAFIAAALAGKASAWPAMAAPGISSSPVGLTGPMLAQASSEEITQYYAESVDPGVQTHCVACHSPGGIAQQSGARIILSSKANDNHRAFEALMADEALGADWILG